MARLSTSAAVIDASGHVLAHTGPGPWRDLPGDTSVPIPGGGRLVVRERDDWAWHRFARAFVHDMRSPLQALAIYLDLLGRKLAPPAPDERPGATGPHLLEKSETQVERLTAMLESFARVFAARADDGTDAHALARGAAGFAEYLAKSNGTKLAVEAGGKAYVAADPGAFTDALVPTLVRLLTSAPGTQVALRVEEEGPAVKVLLSSNPPMTREVAERALAAFEAAGARVELTGGPFEAVFARGDRPPIDDEGDAP